MRTYRIRPTPIAELEDDDVVIGHDGKPVLWRNHPERIVMKDDSSWHYPKVVDPLDLWPTEELIWIHEGLHDRKPVQGVMAIRSVATTDHTRHLYTLLDRGTISPEVGADRDCVYSYEPVPCALPIGRNKDNPDNLIYTIN